MTSIGAGVIHAAAAGVHAEHPQLARLFILCAVAQIGAGLLAWPARTDWSPVLIVAVNAVAVGAWLATRITGISWIEGLEVREAPQFADTACALLGRRRGRLRVGGGDGRQARRPPRHACRFRRWPSPRSTDPGDAQRRHPRAQPRRCAPRRGSGSRRRVAAAQPHRRRHLGDAPGG